MMPRAQAHGSRRRWCTTRASVQGATWALPFAAFSTLRVFDYGTPHERQWGRCFAWSRRRLYFGT
eukprot:scaffold98644_cov28-Tisochrysis_lutea.AAC.5